MVLSAGAGVAVALGDTGSVALGFGDGGTDAVFAGTVAAIHRGLAGETRVAALNGGAALAALRLNRSYEKRSVGDIVRDLAGEAGVDTGAIEGGPTLPFYVVDDGRNGWTHIADLAAKSGFLARLRVRRLARRRPRERGQSRAVVHVRAGRARARRCRAAAGRRGDHGRRRRRGRVTGRRRLELARQGSVRCHRDRRIR